LEVHPGWEGSGWGSSVVVGERGRRALEKARMEDVVAEDTVERAEQESLGLPLVRRSDEPKKIAGSGTNSAIQNHHLPLKI
jgi:hypothetical protein